jgi:hypothetical protein
MKLWKEGDRSRAACETCKQFVTTRFERRTIDLKDAEVSVPDVLVAVCETCGEIVAIPHQSTPRLQEARRRATPKCEVRVPPVLNDALGLLASKFSVRTEEFGGLIIRYYLQRMGNDLATARRIKAFAASSLAKGKTTGRISIRLAEPVWEEAWKVAREAGLNTKSEVFRGVIVAAAVDSEIAREEGLMPSGDFKRAIETIALATSDARPIAGIALAVSDPRILRTRRASERQEPETIEEAGERVRSKKNARLPAATPKKKAVGTKA